MSTAVVSFAARILLAAELKAGQVEDFHPRAPCGKMQDRVSQLRVLDQTGRADCGGAAADDDLLLEFKTSCERIFRDGRLADIPLSVACDLIQTEHIALLSSFPRFVDTHNMNADQQLPVPRKVRLQASCQLGDRVKKKLVLAYQPFDL